MLPPSRLRALRSHFIARYSLHHVGSFAGCSCFRPFSCPSQLLHLGLKRLKPLFVTAGLQRTWLSLHSPSLGKASPHCAPWPARQERCQPWEGGLTALFLTTKPVRQSPRECFLDPARCHPHTSGALFQGQPQQELLQVQLWTAQTCHPQHALGGEDLKKPHVPG